jgi:serine/threonine-protein kinase
MKLEAETLVAGRYRLLGRLGSGGMADVWCAEDTMLDRRVALKFLHERFAQDEQFVERFRREASSAAGLQHPNVVGVFDRGTFDGSHYIAMEYVEGAALNDLIERGISVGEAVEIVRQVLAGARYAHANGIVHRDLKPQNVLVDAEGRARVTDFGIARAGVSEITQTGSVLGTAQYLSPEQAQGLPVTAASDIYSIGVLLYEALTGRVPFEGESAVAVAMKQVSQTPLRPSSLNPAITPALDGVVMRALEKDPGQRFQSADAFIAALDAAMREPGGAGTADFAALPPAVAALPAEDAAAEEEEERRRRRWVIAAIVAAIVIGLLVGLALTRDNSTEVPSVTGNPLNVAIALLQQDGFEVGEVRRVEREAPRDEVLEQNPSAGEASLECSFVFFCSKPEVTLTVSGGPGSGKVPGVAGLTSEQATERLEEAGFEVAAENVNSESVEAGLVVNSEPSGGSTATNGSTVTIFVSRGPKQVSVPALVGVQRSAAVERLRGRGLEAVVSEQEDSAPAGQVISQSPEAGTEVARGSQVSIVVSAGEEKAVVPNVIGQERREAVEAIRAAGLTPVVEEEETEVEEQIGRVIDQFPPPGRELRPGDEVTLFVGKRALGGGEGSEEP